MDAEISVGQVYERDDERYEVKDIDLTTKAPGDANWHAAVAYESLDNDEPVRVRTVADFLAKFTLVDDCE